MCTFSVKKYTYVCVFFCTFAADLWRIYVRWVENNNLTFYQYKQKSLYETEF